MKHPIAAMPFADFIQALKDLEAVGMVRVDKWPTNPTDGYRVKVLAGRQRLPAVGHAA